MLRTNLATRPFYNERVVHLLIALAGVIVLAITAFNLVKVLDLSRHNTELSARVARDRAEVDRLTREAGRTRRGIEQSELATVAAAVREANALIDQRTFSWTALFNQIEATLPPDVMVTAVRPSVQRDATRVSLAVLGRNTDDLETFMEKMEATGAFQQIVTRQQDMTEDGLHRVMVDAVYVGPAGEPQPAEKSRPAEPGKPSDKSTPSSERGAAGAGRPDNETATAAGRSRPATAGAWAQTSPAGGPSIGATR